MARHLLHASCPGLSYTNIIACWMNFEPRVPDVDIVVEELMIAIRELQAPLYVHLNEKYLVAFSVKPSPGGNHSSSLAGMEIFGQTLLIPEGALSPYISLEGYTTIGYSRHPATAEGFRKLRQHLLDCVVHSESELIFQGSDVP